MCRAGHSTPVTLLVAGYNVRIINVHRIVLYHVRMGKAKNGKVQISNSYVLVKEEVCPLGRPW